MSFIDWKDIFDEIFEGLSDSWSFTLVSRDNQRQLTKLENERYKMERKGYAKFHCSKCSNTWASANAMVVFYYGMKNVSMRFFGQKCMKCRAGAQVFMDPDFDEEAIRKFLTVLRQRVEYNIYKKPKPFKTQTKNENQRQMNGPHAKNLCEACQRGFCDKP